jgi:hypothetical protein
MKAGSSSAREEGLDESRPYNFISGKASPADSGYVTKLRNQIT